MSWTGEVAKKMENSVWILNIFEIGLGPGLDECEEKRKVKND